MKEERVKPSDPSRHISVHNLNLWSRIDPWRKACREETVLLASGLVRLGGLAAMLAGVVFLVDEILGLMNPAPYLDIMFVVAMLFVLAGMVGFHALQQGHYGGVGWVSFYAIVVGVLAQVLGLVFLLSGSMALLWLLPVATLAVLVGFAIYGVATLRARVLPRWCGVALIVAFPAAIALGTYAYFWLGLVWLALGYVLWRQSGTATERSSRVS